MSTTNFYNQKNFNLYVKAFEPISLEEYKTEYFEDDAYHYELYQAEENENLKATILENSYESTMDYWNEIFYEDIFNGADGFKELMENFNDELTFHKIELKNGYYDGVQLYVNEMENPHNLDNEDCKYYYDMFKSQAVRKYDAEIRKINKWMKKVAVEYGWKKLNCLGVFSNGEAVYQYA